MMAPIKRYGLIDAMKHGPGHTASRDQDDHNQQHHSEFNFARHIRYSFAIC